VSEQTEQLVGASLPLPPPAAAPARPPLLDIASREKERAASVPPEVAGYEILEELGRGGMGVVYKAWHKRLRRLVAIKMLTDGSGAQRQEHARLQTEAEALARLQHPNIVQVYEVGEYQGRLYLVLEHVDGGSLDRRLAGTPQPAADAALLIETLARAIHAAHQRDIIHRDLKPANILLANAGREPPVEKQPGVGPGAALADCIAKITDFGLAKRLDVALGQTQTGVVMGTPSYMPPEQALGQSKAVGPGADIYALGAILYEMLTGRPPFRGENVLDTLQQVLSRDPLAPRALHPKVPRDLETICLKCLEKEKTKRYPTAQALAEDLRRFRAGEAIWARPTGVVERLWRWTRRRPAIAGLLAGLVVVGVSGLAGVTEFAVRAERQRREARANFQLAMDAVEQYCTKVSEDLRLREQDLRPLRQQLLQTAVEFHEKFADKYADQPGLRAELGQACLRLGDLTAEIDARPRAIAYFERARQIFHELSEAEQYRPEHRESLAQAHAALGRLYGETGKRDEAEQALQTAVAILEQLTKDNTDFAPYQRRLAQTYQVLSNVYQRGSLADKAESPCRAAITLCEGLVHRSPNNRVFRRELADSYASLGDLVHYHFVRRWQEGEVAYKKAIEVQDELIALDPRSAEYRFTMASYLRRLGCLYRITGRADTAEASLKKSRTALEDLVREHSFVTPYQKELGNVYEDLGNLYYFTGRIQPAEEPWRSALRVWELLTARDPSDTISAGFLGTNQCNLATLIREKGDPQGALAWFGKSIATLEAAHGRDPRQANLPRFLTVAHEERARTFTLLARHTEALQDWDSVLEYERGLLRPWFKMQRALTLARLGDHSRATAEASALVQGFAQHSHSGQRLCLEAARVYCVAAGRAKDDQKLSPEDRLLLIEVYGASAIELLRRVVQDGNKDVAQATQNKDFELVRSRADFRNLIAELQKKEPPAGAQSNQNR
jgi:tetratricopeptide (TPR) repeat protein